MISLLEHKLLDLSLDAIGEILIIRFDNADIVIKIYELTAFLILPLPGGLTFPPRKLIYKLT